MRIGRWSELSVDSVCQEHEVMRDADANETSDVFPSSAFIESSSRWGSDRDSGDDGFLEKVIDL